MTTRLPRYRTGVAELDDAIVKLLDELGVEKNRDVIFEIFAAAARLGRDEADRLNLKITSAAVREMREAFRIFEPYNQVPKVTIFGSARTLPEDPLYFHARDSAAELAREGWMVVTGAGPGIMAAGLEGAGRDNSFGVSIRLPFEAGANEFIAKDPKLIEMRYFFTRKLMLIKESDGFISLPGGFGTLDEMFELLTLVSRGKADPVPIVLLDVPGGTFWQGFDDYVRNELLTRDLIVAEDCDLYLITSSIDEAVNELLQFWRNYHSQRYVSDRLVIRLRSEPTDEEVAQLNEAFSDICSSGQITKIPATTVEVNENDVPDLPRLTLHFDRFSYGRYRLLIDAINQLDSAPPVEGPPPRDA